MSKRTVSLLMLLAPASALLAACGNQTPPTTTTQATGSGADATTAEAITAEAETTPETVPVQAATAAETTAVDQRASRRGSSCRTASTPRISRGWRVRAGVGTQYTTTGGPPSQFPAAAQMTQDYEAKFGAPAPPYSPQAYDAAGVCMTAIAMAAETANGKPTRQQVLDAIEEFGVYRGITGDIDFNENGEPTRAPYFIQEVTSADPARWSDNRIVQKLEREPPAWGQ